MLKKIKIVSRNSPLAKIQALKVGNAILTKFPTIDIIYCSKQSDGDLNPNQKLYSGNTTTGLFTHNISASISNEEFDIGVHSWKDIPIEPAFNTSIFGTIERGDMRDMLFLKKGSLTNLSNGNLNIFTSSPRRKYLSQKKLSNFLPFDNSELNFIDIRGNIETRLKKFFESNVDGILIAKTAIDRLLSKDYSSVEKEKHNKIKKYMQSSRWMILPLSWFPTAPGQGAIGIEIHKSNAEAQKIVKQINNEKVFNDVSDEKKILSKYGGGCHQKIGVSIWRNKGLKLMSVCGETETGETLDNYEIINQKNANKNDGLKISDAFPVNENEKRVFVREDIDSFQKISEIKDSLFYISRKNVLDNKPKIHDSNLIWTSGLQSWLKAAQSGYWVNGSSESFGETTDFRINSFVNSEMKKYKLSHSKSDSSNMDLIPVYKLEHRKKTSNISNKTHFYWMSSFAFDFYVNEYPEIKSKNHACGPGKTYDHILKVLKNSENLTKYLSYEDWKKSFESK